MRKLQDHGYNDPADKVLEFRSQELSSLMTYFMLVILWSWSAENNWGNQFLDKLTVFEVKVIFIIVVNCLVVYILKILHT